ncbi:unnamed protein product, partial [Urochloa humidicola]
SSSPQTQVHARTRPPVPVAGGALAQQRVCTIQIPGPVGFTLDPCVASRLAGKVRFALVMNRDLDCDAMEVFTISYSYVTRLYYGCETNKVVSTLPYNTYRFFLALNFLFLVLKLC